MKPGDLVRVIWDPTGDYVGRLGLVVAVIDMESYFNPYVVLLAGVRRFYREGDLIIVSEDD